VIHGEVFKAQNLPTLVPSQRRISQTYHIRSASDIFIAEIVSLDAVSPREGIGTAFTIHFSPIANQLSLLSPSKQKS